MSAHITQVFPNSLINNKKKAIFYNLNALHVSEMSFLLFIFLSLASLYKLCTLLLCSARRRTDGPWRLQLCGGFAEGDSHLAEASRRLQVAHPDADLLRLASTPRPNFRCVNSQPCLSLSLPATSSSSSQFSISSSLVLLHMDWPSALLEAWCNFTNHTFANISRATPVDLWWPDFQMREI